MKKILITLLFLCPIFFCMGQKVNLDDFKINIKYTELPQNPLPDSLVSFNVSYSLYENYQDLDIKKANVNSYPLNISGFRRNINNPDFILQVNFMDFRVDEPTFNVNTYKEDDKKGGEITKEEHTFTLKYYLPTQCIIVNSKGKTLRTFDVSFDYYTFTSEKFTSKSAADDKAKYGRTKLLKFLANQKIVELQQNLEQILSLKLGYKEMDFEENFVSLGSKKHPEYTNWNENIGKIKEELEKMTFAVKGAKDENVKNALEYFSSISSKFISKEKEDIRLRYAAYKNLMLWYYYTDSFENAGKYADSLVLNDFNKKEGEIVKKRIVTLQKSFAVNQVKERHINRTALLEKSQKSEATFLVNKEAKLEHIKLENAKYTQDATSNRGDFLNKFNDEAKPIIEKYINAVGGIDLFNQVKSAHIVLNKTIFRIPIPLIEESWIIDGKNYKHQYGKIIVKTKTIINEREGWEKDFEDNETKALGFAPMNSTSYDQHKDNLNIWNSFLNLPPTFSARILEISEETFQEQECNVIKIDLLTIRFDSESSFGEKYYFSKKTGLLMFVVTGEGNPGDQITSFLDYQPADGVGILVPRTIHNKILGPKIKGQLFDFSLNFTIKQRFSKIEFNKNIDVTVFELK